MYECVVKLCPYCPSLFPLLFLPFWWTQIFVLPTVMFCVSSGKCAALPTHSQRTVSLVSVSLSHINMPQSLSSPSLSSCCLSSPLTQPPLWRQLSFCLAVVCFWPLLCQCCQLSPLSTGPWISILHVHPQCPSCSFLSSSLIYFSCSLFFYHLLSCTAPPFFSVLSFIHSSHLLFIPPLSFLCLTGPQKFLLKRIPSTGG